MRALQARRAQPGARLSTSGRTFAARWSRGGRADRPATDGRGQALPRTACAADGAERAGCCTILAKWVRAEPISVECGSALTASYNKTPWTTSIVTGGIDKVYFDDKSTYESAIRRSARS
jgi:hypothetical protein